MSVLLPAPLGPAMPSTWPAGTASVRSSRARTRGPRRGRYSFETAVKAIMYPGRGQWAPGRDLRLGVMEPRICADERGSSLLCEQQPRIARMDADRSAY